GRRELSVSRKRSVSDEEIALIKTMLKRGMRNRDIQFYFNRPDRPVNSGRISQIRGGSYGASIAPATDLAVTEFIASFSSHAAGGGADDAASLMARAAICFECRDDGEWYLIDGGESATVECKVTFDPSRLLPLVRAIAA